MKKVFLLLLLIPLVLMGCKFDDSPVAKMPPSFDDINFSQYESFLLSYADNLSRSTTATKSLYGVKDETYDKITITSERGEQWSVSEIEKTGGNLMALALDSNDSFGDKAIALVNVDTDEAYDLTETIGSDYSFKLSDIRAYDNGLAIKKEGTVYKLNLEDEALVPVNDSDVDYCREYFATKSGHVVMQTGQDSYKLYPADGSVPYVLPSSCGVNNYHGIFITSEDVDYVVNIASEQKITFSNTGIEISDISSPHILYETYITERKGQNYNFDLHTPPAKVVHYLSPPFSKVILSQIVDGELDIEVYDQPCNMEDDDMAIIDDTIIIEHEGELLTWELGADTTTTIVDSNLADWDISGRSIVYKVYESATDIATYMYDIDTKTTSEKITGTVPEILKLVSF